MGRRRLTASGQFRRDLKRCQKRGKDISKLNKVVELLLESKPLPDVYRDHPLKGNWVNKRDCHVEPDWILIYEVDPENVKLARTGTHADLFE